VSKLGFLAIGFAGALLLVGCGGTSDKITLVHEYAYVGNGDGIRQFEVASNGQLTPLAPAEVTATGVTTLARSGNGKFLYAAAGKQDKVYQYSIQKNGKLSPLSPASVTVAGPAAIATTPQGYVYVLDTTHNSIAQFTTSDGALNAISPASVPTVTDGNALVATPDGKYLYAGGFSTHQIDAYAIGVGGKLTPLPTASYDTGDNVTQLTVSPDGGSLFAGLDAGNIQQYGINSDGSLDTNGVVATAGASPKGLAFTLDGRFAYQANLNAGQAGSPVGQYSFNVASGNLTALTPASIAAGNAPYGVAVNATSQFVYVTNVNDGTVSQFAVNSDGTLSALSPDTLNVGPAAFDIVLARR